MRPRKRRAALRSLISHRHCIWNIRCCSCSRRHYYCIFNLCLLTVGAWIFFASTPVLQVDWPKPLTATTTITSTSTSTKSPEEFLSELMLNKTQTHGGTPLDKTQRKIVVFVFDDDVYYDDNHRRNSDPREPTFLQKLVIFHPQVIHLGDLRHFLDNFAGFGTSFDTSAANFGKVMADLSTCDARLLPAFVNYANDVTRPASSEPYWCLRKRYISRNKHGLEIGTTNNRSTYSSKAVGRDRQNCRVPPSKQFRAICRGHHVAFDVSKKSYADYSSSLDSSVVKSVGVLTTRGSNSNGGCTCQTRESESDQQQTSGPTFDVSEDCVLKGCALEMFNFLDIYLDESVFQSIRKLAS